MSRHHFKWGEITAVFVHFCERPRRKENVDAVGDRGFLVKLLERQRGRDLVRNRRAWFHSGPGRFFWGSRWDGGAYGH